MRCIFVMLAALGTINVSLALNPHKALSQYSRTVWTQQDGLPGSSVRAIAQTPDGYLWVGTDDGLARFDGYEFVVFSKQPGQLPASSVNALAVQSDGSLWIGTSAGLVHYEGQRFRTYTKNDGLPGDTITSLLIDHGGALWMLSAGQLGRMRNGQFETFLAGRDIPVATVRGIAQDSGSVLYIAGFNAVAKFEDGKFSTAIPASTLQTFAAVGVHVDLSGNLWVLGNRGMLERTKEGTLQRFGTTDGLPDSLGIGALRSDAEGRMWAGISNTVARFDGRRFEARSVSENGEPDAIHALFDDKQGNLWVATDTGLVRFRDDLFTTYGKSEGLSSDAPDAVFEDHARRTWVGFLDGGFMLFAGPGSGPSAPRFKMPKGRVFAFHETRDGELLVSSSDGLFRIKDNRVRSFVPPDPLGRKIVYDAIEDPSGSIWLALSNGLGRLRGDRFEMILPVGPADNESPSTLALGQDGSIWAGQRQSGLIHMAGEQVEHFTTANGLGSGAVRSVYADKDGIVWIGTLGGGLHALIRGKMVRFTAQDGLLSDNIWKILDDGDSLWLSTTRGICKVAKKQLLDFADHRVDKLRPTNYDTSDGLRAVHFPATVASGGMRASDGSLWFVTSRGLAVYNPGEPQRIEASPAVRVLDMTVDGSPVDLSKSLDIPSGRHRVRIRYSAVHLRAPERIRYFYKLAGLDTEWVAAGARRVVNYDDLGRGNYRFQVRAELPGTPPTETSYEFTLLPHFYETKWFWLLAAALLGGLVWAVHLFRVGQVRSRYALVLEERARLAREVHDTLAQGFVGISSQLEAVAAVIPQDPNRAGKLLELARQMTSHSLTEARRSLMDLRSSILEDNDLATALQTEARSWTNGSGVELQIETEGETKHISEEVAHHVFRIAQEAVNNVVKHASAKRIQLQLRAEAHRLRLSIADDGCGFSEDRIFSPTKGHFGLQGMRERAERVDGTFTVESHPGAGTRLNVVVPL